MKKSDFIFKVCGMREVSNIRALEALEITWMGMIFFQKSPRHVVNPVPKENDTIQRIGVFVNASSEYIDRKIKMHDLNGIQLHGVENREDCQEIKDRGLITIKAFSVDESFDFAILKAYHDACDYFLFDTKGRTQGGTGIRFDWSLLAKYQGPTPFILSGGLGPEHVQEIKDFNHQYLHGIDINSRFEIKPAQKNIEAIKRFKDELFS